MALTTAQQASYLFKRIFGKSSASTAKDFFEEPYNGLPAILPSQIWAQASLIPNAAPGGTNLQVTGVVKRYIDLVLTAVPGVANAFYSASLVNAIPFNFGDGSSYNYTLKDSASASVPFGLGDWIVDPATGTLTFYTSTPASVPPKISFYQYIGNIGVSDTVPETPQTLTEGATNQPVTALFFSGGAFKTAVIEWQLYRVSTAAGAMELTGYGRFAIIYKPTASTWSFTPLEQAGDDTLVTFDVTTLGQVRYSLPAITGTTPASTLKTRARTFTA